MQEIGAESNPLSYSKADIQPALRRTRSRVLNEIFVA